MADLNSVKFDHSPWQEIEKKPHMQVWGDDIKRLSAVLSLEYFDSAPEINVSLKQVPQIRFLYRSLANQSGAGLISAEVLEVDGLECIETVFKMPQPNRGFVYIGSLTVPFADFSYVVKLQCVELGYTGVREATILERLMGSGVEIAADGQIQGWEADPYDQEGLYPFMPNVAEDTKYDDEFPTHALSRLRVGINHIKETLRFDEELMDAAPFDPSA